ncbi:nuclear transport factor 2 family protein [Paracoccus sp. MKU1]|uniref:nuclear transport factor 2 family protein n=1 Tax=Paracoccus sp. MKU1 TaxID=1745182 RepID=UPI0007192749|nr:nuclear transport factor 2 family protein [Paracoccus sp. MKU1]KRW97034.1 hypothetical protein AQY21_05840 [Paracoccus sp. MKU1]
MTTKGDLEARLLAMEDMRAIEDVLCAYGEALDYGLEDQFVDLFTEDGIWMIRRAGAEDRVYQGSEQLRKFAMGHTRAPTKIHKHVFTNLKIIVDGDTAKADCYFFRLDASAARDPAVPSLSDSFIFEMGRYHDDLVRCADGKWRFKLRQVLGEDDRANRQTR